MLTAKQIASEYFEFYVLMTRPVENSALDGEIESRMEQISIMNNGRPCKPQIEAKIAEYFPGWSYWRHWMPEPTDDMGEPIFVRKAA